MSSPFVNLAILITLIYFSYEFIEVLLDLDFGSLIGDLIEFLLGLLFGYIIMGLSGVFLIYGENLLPYRSIRPP
jgi:hypothetical protein